MDDPRLSLERRLRIAAVALILAWFFVPGLRDWIPAWVPFLAFAALELNFLVGGLRDWGSATTKRGRLPQESDIEELGGEEWLEPVLVEVDGRDVWLPEGAESEEDVEPPPPLRRRAPRWAGSKAWRSSRRSRSSCSCWSREEAGTGSTPRTGRRPRRSSRRRRAGSRATRRVVHCDARGEAVGIVQHADGIAEVGGRNAYLTPDICYRLYRLAFKDDEGAFSQTARAIAVLAHEAWHLRGETDEGVTNCYAFQSGVALGERLGLSEGTAARMMRQQLADNAAFGRSAPEYLVPGECRDGGRLDLDPGSSRFPTTQTRHGTDTSRR